MPELDHDLCNGCNLCVVVCHSEAIVQEGDRIRIVETGNCDFCGVCEAVCPQKAIKCSYVIVTSEV